MPILKRLKGSSNQLYPSKSEVWVSSMWKLCEASWGYMGSWTSYDAFGWGWSLQGCRVRTFFLQHLQIYVSRFNAKGPQLNDKLSNRAISAHHTSIKTLNTKCEELLGFSGDIQHFHWLESPLHVENCPERRNMLSFIWSSWHLNPIRSVNLPLCPHLLISPPCMPWREITARHYVQPTVWLLTELHEVRFHLHMLSEVWDEAWWFVTVS